MPHPISKRDREQVEIAEAEGLTVDRIEYGRHLKLYVRNPAGVEGMIVCAISTSDQLSIQAHRSRCRRFARRAE
jgi:hypothetical protein